MPESSEPISNKGGGGSWELPPSIMYRDAIIGRGEIGVVRWSVFDWSEHSHSYALVLFPSAPALGELIWRNASEAKPNRNQITGRQACFIAPNVPHAACWGRKAEMLLILIRPSFFQRELGRHWVEIVVGEFAALIAQDRMIWWLNSLCWRLCRKPDPKDHPLIEEIGRSLARRLIVAQFSVRGVSRKKATVLSPAQLQKLTEYIEADWAHARTVDELAKVVGLSREHFMRVFKNATGVSPARYQKICRMRKAEEMLRSGNYRIEEIAFALGFKEASYFSRCFRENFDMTPTEFMDEFRGQKS